MNTIDIYLKTVRKIPLLTREQEIAIGYRAMEGDEEAINKLVEHNLRFVIFLAKKVAIKYRNYHEFQDLIEQGNIGLINAARNYKPEKGRFVAYAKYSILRSIISYVTTNMVVHLPQNIVEKYQKFNKQYEKLAQELARKPTIQEISEGTEYSIDEIKKILAHDPNRLKNPVYLDNITHSNDADILSLYNVIISELKTHPKYPNDIKEAIKHIIESDGLTTYEKRILMLRYRLDDNRSNEIRTLREVGEIIGLTKQAINLIEKRALQKLRESEQFKRLQEELYEE